MNSRIDINELEPDAYTGIYSVDKYLGSTDMDPKLRELIKIRASQINKCAYCIQTHSEHALNLGETNQRIFALSAWDESPLFSELERAVLALTDEVTLISDHGVSQGTYDAAMAQLGENGLARCIMQIVTINAWNRIALSTRMQHGQV